MTLIIAFMLMAHMDVHWIWYPVVFIIWLAHLAWHADKITIRRGT